MQNIEVSEKSGYIMVTNVDYVSATSTHSICF